MASSCLLEPLQRSPSSVTSDSGPAPRPQRALWSVCPFILGTELCERLAFYGVAFNLTTFITSVMGGTAAMAGVWVSLFWGACYSTPLLGAFVADSYWGRYKTILVFAIVYVMGVGLLVASVTLPGLARHAGEEGSANAVQFSALAVALATIALGTGGIKANVSPFGADQFNLLDPQDAMDKERFFGYFYMSVNIGSLLAATTIVYVQDSIGWALGFAIPGVMLLLALALFVAGQRHYKTVLPVGSPLARAVAIVIAAIRHRLRRHGGRSDYADAEVAPCAPSTQTGTLRRRCLPFGAAAGSQEGAGHVGSDEDCEGSGPDSMALGRGWVEDAVTRWQQDGGKPVAEYTQQQVDDVKQVLRVLPIFFATIPYWTVYATMGSFFVQQGNLMQRTLHIAGRSVQVPAASMNVSCTGAVLLLIPCYHHVIAPFERHWSRKITVLQRMGTGLVLITIGMLATCLVEMWRLTLMAPPSDTATISELSIFWQVVPYSIIGASEVFTSVGMLDFFYDQFPDSMRSCGIALNFLSTALGGYLCGGLVATVQTLTASLGHAWLPGDLNQGRLDLFFLLLAAIMVLATLVFVYVARRFEYKVVETHQPRALDAPYGGEALLLVGPSVGAPGSATRLG